jgi:hypothetical protein
MSGLFETVATPDGNDDNDDSDIDGDGDGDNDAMSRPVVCIVPLCAPPYQSSLHGDCHFEWRREDG